MAEIVRGSGAASLVREDMVRMLSDGILEQSLGYLWKLHRHHIEQRETICRRVAEGFMAQEINCHAFGEVLPAHVT